jgi:CBS domain-containing protein
MILIDLVTRAAVAVRREAPVVEAARQMQQHNVGSVIVLDEIGSVVGILTDRDIVMKLAEGRFLDPDQRVEELMTRDPVCLQGALPIERGLAAMRTHKIRRVPVINDRGELVGVVSLDDILVQMGRSMGEAARLIEAEVVGRPEDRWPLAPSVMF